MIEKKQKIHKCIFPAAGYGTRFLPVTKSSPKEMLPIVDKPLIHYGVEEAFAAEIEDMVFIVGRNKEAIVNYFDINVELETQIANKPVNAKLADLRTLLQSCTFSYVRQGQIKGLGHAILSARHCLRGEPFAVCLADDLCLPPGGDMKNGVLEKMRRLYEEYACTILAVTEVADEHVHNYGIVEAKECGKDLYEVLSLVEKPEQKDAPSNLAIIGRYILQPSIFDELAKEKIGAGHEIQLTDAIASEAKKGGRILAYKIDGNHFDCGDIGQYARAIWHVACARNLISS